MKKEIIKTNRFINYFLLVEDKERLDGYHLQNGYVHYFDARYCYQWINEKARDKFYLGRLR